MPQGSIEGLLLFNLFLYTTVLSNYADGNNLYAIGNDKGETNRALAKDFQTAINWFYENYMILNTEKCYYMCKGKDLDENYEPTKNRRSRSFRDKNKSKTIISPTFHQHF